MSDMRDKMAKLLRQLPLSLQKRTDVAEQAADLAFVEGYVRGMGDTITDDELKSALKHIESLRHECGARNVNTILNA